MYLCSRFTSVKTYTTCFSTYNLSKPFELVYNFRKTGYKIRNLVPNMCVTKKISTTSLTFMYNLLSIESLAYRLVSQSIILCALYDKMAAESFLI